MKNKNITSILLLVYVAIQLSSCYQNLVAQAPALPGTPDSLYRVLTRKEAMQLLKFEMRNEPYRFGRGIAAMGFGFASGTSWGFHETSVHKPFNYPDSWDPQFWDASMSWRNKYENGNPSQGERFPLSTTALVAFTDAKHLFSSGHKLGIAGAGVCVGITIGERRPWWQWGTDILLASIGYSLGFHTTYTYQMWWR